MTSRGGGLENPSGSISAQGRQNQISRGAQVPARQLTARYRLLPRQYGGTYHRGWPRRARCCTCKNNITVCTSAQYLIGVLQPQRWRPSTAGSRSDARLSPTSPRRPCRPFFRFFSLLLFPRVTCAQPTRSSDRSLRAASSPHTVYPWSDLRGRPGKGPAKAERDLPFFDEGGVDDRTQAESTGKEGEDVVHNPAAFVLIRAMEGGERKDGGDGTGKKRLDLAIR